MSIERLQRLVVFALIGAILGVGCSPPRNPAPDPARSITDLAFRNRAVDDVCDLDVDAWPAVFGDVRLDTFDASMSDIVRDAAAVSASTSTWLDSSLSVGMLAERLSRSGGGSRVRDRHETVLEQLEQLTVDDFTTAWARARARFAERGVERLSLANSLDVDEGGNAACGFLVNHVVALRFAAMARDTLASDPAWTFALAHEAAALGYLVDAMSADRMLDARSPGPFFAFSRNRRDAERYFGRSGVYVIDHRGHVWQAFGRDQLEWYPTHLCRVMATSQEAVRELYLMALTSRSGPLPPYLSRFVAADPLGRDAETITFEWSLDRSGPSWLADQRLGSLASLPTPIWSTWRRKVGEPNADGVRPAVHRPQLREEGLYDPSIASPPSVDDEVASRRFVDLDRLHRLGAFPSWVSPADWLEDGPAAAIEHDRDMASTRFVHLVRYPPSFSGMYVTGSLGVGVEHDEIESTHSVGIGYMRHLALAWLGAQVEFSPDFLRAGRDVVAVTGVVGLAGPVHRPSMWMEIGVARAETDGTEHYGFRGRVGWVPFTIGPGPRYAGFSPRLELDVTGLDPARVHAGIGLVLH